MSLWVDKYRPTSLGKLDYHKEQATQLKNLVSKLKLLHERCLLKLRHNNKFNLL